MNKPLIALFAAGLVGAAIAAEPAQPEHGQKMRQPLFDQMRTLESQSHQGRMQILKEAEGCIQAARTPQTFRACEHTEHAAREALRDSMQPQRQALRDEFQHMRREQAHGAPQGDRPESDKP